MDKIQLEPLEHVPPEALDDLLDRARNERWTELVLIGPHRYLVRNGAQRPEQYRNSPRIFRLTNSVNDLPAKLAELTHLASLSLEFHRLDPVSAQAIILSMTGLASLNLDGNRIGLEGARAIAQAQTGPFPDRPYLA
jgi:hypothetical protein